jgi:hypothetical protein
MEALVAFVVRVLAESRTARDLAETVVAAD